MKKLHLAVLFILFIILFNSCFQIGNPYVVKNFEINMPMSATIGSKIINVELRNSEVFEGSNGFVQEIIYNGVANNTLYLSYREYLITREGKFIREAFSQNFYYEYEPNETISFRTFKIEVFEANTNEIKYKIIKWNSPYINNSVSNVDVVDMYIKPDVLYKNVTVRLWSGKEYKNVDIRYNEYMGIVTIHDKNENIKVKFSEIEKVTKKY